MAQLSTTISSDSPAETKCLLSIRGESTALSNDMNERAVMCGGAVGSSGNVTMDYITISTIGNAVDFGDLVRGTSRSGGGSSNGTNDRGIIHSDYPATIFIEYITISTPGNATDFGKLRSAMSDAMGGSNSAK